MLNFFGLFLLLLFTVSAHAQAGYINYFETVPKEDFAKALAPLKVKDCRTFHKQYLESHETTFIIVMSQAAAYDTGICVDQDLKKAQQLYEKIFSTNPDFFVGAIRLGVIYEFGPAELRNNDRAGLLFKQATISMANIPEDIRWKGATGSVNNKPVPDDLKKDLDWIKETLAMDTDERRKIAENLKKQGFVDTDFIWSSFKETQK